MCKLCVRVKAPDRGRSCQESGSFLFNYKGCSECGVLAATVETTVDPALASSPLEALRAAVAAAANRRAAATARLATSIAGTHPAGAVAANAAVPLPSNVGGGEAEGGADADDDDDDDDDELIWLSEPPSHLAGCSVDGAPQQAGLSVGADGGTEVDVVGGGCDGTDAVADVAAGRHPHGAASGGKERLAGTGGERGGGGDDDASADGDGAGAGGHGHGHADDTGTDTDTSTDSDDDEERTVYWHLCGSCGHTVAKHTYTFEVRDGYQESSMLCLLCGRASDTQSVLPTDPRKARFF